MLAPIAEKTLAHPTDAICWDDMPAGACELEFRPPSAFELKRTSIQFGLQLTKACLVTNGLTWLVYWVLLPQVGWDTNPFGFIAVVTGCLLGAAVLFAEPTLSLKRKWPSLRVALMTPAVLIIGSWFYAGVGYDVTWTGCLLYCVLALPLMLVVCQQVNKHTTYWLTADFTLPKKQQWRAVFVADGVVIDSSKIRTFQQDQFWCSCLTVAALVTVPVVVVFFRLSGQSLWTWPVMSLPLISLWLTYLILNGFGEKGIDTTRPFGHWLRYGRGETLAPYVFQSPCGSSTTRLLLIWGAAGAISHTLAMTISNATGSFDGMYEGSIQGLAMVAWFDHFVAALVAPWIVTLVLRLNVSRLLVALEEEK